MDTDLELDRWRQEWQASTTVTADFERRVQRQTRLMRWDLLLQVLVTVGMGGWTLGWALVTSRVEIVVLAVGTWIAIAAGWTFSLINRRGTWKPAMATTAGFLDLSIVRCRRNVRRLTFTAGFYGMLLTFVLAVLYASLASVQPMTIGDFLGAPFLLPIWAITAGLAGVAWWRRGVLRRELEALADLRRALNDPLSQPSEMR